MTYLIAASWPESKFQVPGDKEAVGLMSWIFYYSIFGQGEEVCGLIVRHFKNRLNPGRF
jgi:hypothetical protein